MPCSQEKVGDWEGRFQEQAQLKQINNKHIKSTFFLKKPFPYPFASGERSSENRGLEMWCFTERSFFKDRHPHMSSLEVPWRVIAVAVEHVVVPVPRQHDHLRPPVPARAQGVAEERVVAVKLGGGVDLPLA